VRFASLFGELDDVTPYNKLGKKHRLSTDYLFDVSNLNEDGSIAKLSSHRAAMNRGNTLFHVDSSFNPRRGGYSLLRAAKLPPPGTGGATEFADARTAFEELSEDLKRELVERNYVAAHSLFHSRKKASPDALKDVDPMRYPMARHRLVQMHEPSKRMNLYIASHVHHLEGVDGERSRELIEVLYSHACQRKYVVSVEWLNEGDLVMWDNTCVMHRATGGSFEGKYSRDMRRATVHDGSSHAWGLNEVSSERQGFP
jgi:alpha-ketoglutarate-dependent 2,4-dichlorophenoxyacetate dioxygenase